MVEPVAGDEVVVETKDDRIKGVLMPRPHLSDRKHLTIKLGNGYNIGVDKSRIKSVRVVGKYRERKKRVAAHKIGKPGKPTVAIISTGGTISSKIDYRTGGVYASLTSEELLESAPELADIAEIKSSFLMNVMSEDMNPSLWKKMASSVAQELNSGAGGVVLTHGTDTMHYSSAALSFLLPNLGKPVILTGAQRSSDRGSSDAFLNLVCSTVFATEDYGGVYIVMHGSLDDTYCLAHNGTRVRKMHTTRRDAFQSINSKPVAKIFGDGRIQEVGGPSRKRREGKIIPEPKLEEKVALIKVYPGMNPEVIDFYLDRKYRGIVFEGTALGHLPTTIKKSSLIPKIDEAREAGVAMAMTTQCMYGRVHPLVYSNLREVSSRGVIYCEDMLAETAYVKMMWVLSHASKSQEIREMMLSNYAGEISNKTIIGGEFATF